MTALQMPFKEYMVSLPLFKTIPGSIQVIKMTEMTSKDFGECLSGLEKKIGLWKM